MKQTTLIFEIRIAGQALPMPFGSLMLTEDQELWATTTNPTSGETTSSRVWPDITEIINRNAVHPPSE